MQAPAQAFSRTASYVRICGIGIVVIIAYNLIGSVFRGIGDSKTPLVTVAIACVFNIGGDFLLIAVLGMGTKGAAIATVFAQFVSVLISLWMIRRRQLPFTFTRDCIRWDGSIIKRILKLGTPIALQDLLVGISFLVVFAIVNSLGLIFPPASALRRRSVLSLCSFRLRSCSRCPLLLRRTEVRARMTVPYAGFGLRSAFPRSSA